MYSTKAEFLGSCNRSRCRNLRSKYAWLSRICEQRYPQIQEIKSGRYVQGPECKSTRGLFLYGYQLFVKLDNGDEKFFGPCETANELLAEVKTFCEEQVKLGNMQQSEANEIISRYTEN